MYYCTLDMSMEGFHSITIPWKGTDNITTEQEILFKRTLKGYEIFKILQVGKLGVDGTMKDISSLLLTLTQMAIHKAPFDHKIADNLLQLDADILFKIIGGALKAIPLEKYFQDLGIESSLQLQE